MQTQKVATTNANQKARNADLVCNKASAAYSKAYKHLAGCVPTGFWHEIDDKIHRIRAEKYSTAWKKESYKIIDEFLERHIDDGESARKVAEAFANWEIPRLS